MQRLFAEQTDWHTPWIAQVMPQIQRLAEAHAADTVFTRFLTLASPEEGVGTWKRYYRRWRSMTSGELAPGMLDLIPSLLRFVPPAEVVDKTVYSPWLDPDLERRLERRGTDTLVVTGGETDVCVLGTVLGAVDRGFRTVVVTDAICSSADETHDALLLLYRSRYGQQVETATCDQVLEAW